MYFEILIIDSKSYKSDRLKQKEADAGKLSIEEQLQIYRYEKHQKKQQGNKTRSETQRRKWKVMEYIQITVD